MNGKIGEDYSTRPRYLCSSEFHSNGRIRPGRVREVTENLRGIVGRGLYHMDNVSLEIGKMHKGVKHKASFK